MKLGVVSDTHGYCDPRLLEVLQGVDVILHAGDVGSEAVLEALGQIAPVYAVRGNNDEPLGGLGLPALLDVELGGAVVRVVHQLAHAGDLSGIDVLVFGHSHGQLCEMRDGVLLLNPGAAGRVGFHALQTAALLTIEAGVASAEPVVLGPRVKPARRTGASRPPKARRERAMPG